MQFTVKRVETQEELECVYRVVHDAYVSEGYAQRQPDGKLRLYKRYDHLPETSVFIAVAEDGRVIGTVSITGNNMTGLPMSEDFPEEVAKISERSIIMGRYLGGAWRFASEANLRNSLSVVLALIKALIEEASTKNMNEMVYVFNPKHVAFYKRMLGFSTVCERSVGAVNAPGVLMYSDLRHTANKWLNICHKRHIEKTIAIEDFWWPTATATPRNWLDILTQDIPSITSAILALPLLWGILIYDKLFPVTFDSSLLDEFSD